jgi:hypothetical protein
VGHLKGCELVKRSCADRQELIATVQAGSIRARRDRDLLRGLLAGWGPGVLLGVRFVRGGEGSALPGDAGEARMG